MAQLLHRWWEVEMLTAFLAGSGGRVLIPDAVGVAPGEDDTQVRFIDADGRTLVIFQRADVAMYTKDGDSISLDEVKADADASPDGSTVPL
jgi:hypothetical protein